MSRLAAPFRHAEIVSAEGEYVFAVLPYALVIGRFRPRVRVYRSGMHEAGGAVR